MGRKKPLCWWRWREGCSGGHHGGQVRALLFETYAWAAAGSVAATYDHIRRTSAAGAAPDRLELPLSTSLRWTCIHNSVFRRRRPLSAVGLAPAPDRETQSLTYSGL